ncbi:MAG: RrF2 family transcriptional regulator [Myxococcota bacterium]
MTLNKKAEYAISIVIYIYYSTRSGNSVTANQIYDATYIPKKFLTVILSELQRARILKSIRGSNGGYTIERSMKDISLLDIVKATKGIKEKKSNEAENIYQIFSYSISNEIEDEFLKRLGQIDFETLFKRFESTISPMTPMFYI